MKIAIIKYNAGNLFSVDCALQRIGVDSIITDDAEIIKSADKVIFPGVGEASTAMAYLESHGLSDVIRNLNQPVLGICIGLQLLCRHSEEGDVDCLGVFPTNVKRFENIAGYKVPEMGWNSISFSGNKLFKDVESGSYVYFVHSYYAPVISDTIAVSDYSCPFSAAIKRDNFYAVQFHPEKSGRVGERILKNFIEL